MATLQLKNVNKFFGSGTSQVHVLKDINFTAQKGEVHLWHIVIVVQQV